MDLFGLDLANLLLGTLSGLAAALLTYLATRRRAQVSERTIYVSAFDHLTAGLRAEIERVNEGRRELEAVITSLEQRIDELEERERQLRDRIDELERERTQLLDHLRDLMNGHSTTS